MKFQTFPQVTIKETKAKQDCNYISYAIKFPKLGSLSISTEQTAFAELYRFTHKWMLKSTDNMFRRKDMSKYIGAFTDRYGIVSVEEEMTNILEKEAEKSKIHIIRLTPKVILVQCPSCQQMQETLEKAKIVHCQLCDVEFKI